MPVPELPDAYGRLLSARNLLLLLSHPARIHLRSLHRCHLHASLRRPVPGDQALAGGRPGQRWHMRRGAHVTTGNAHLTTEARMPAQRLQS